jgi:peptidoglycan pentaglycine glycine transferase (the first glycine)
MITVRTCDIREDWDEEILSRGGHPLQLWGWGELKAAHKWKVTRLVVEEGETIVGMAQVLIKALPLPFRALAYIPRGPIAEREKREVVLNALADHVKSTYNAVAVTIEPDWEEMPEYTSWKASSNTILIPRTLILDLSRTEEELLADMTKKTRQYIRKSGGELLVVRQVKRREELDACLALYRQTAIRAGFALHSDQYYYDAFDMLGDHSPIFAAFQGDQPRAFLWLAISSQTAFELYGGMDEEGQRLRANYVLKWHAIQTMRKWGIKRYDFNGLLNDGVSTFKQGFSSHEDMLAGTYDKPLSPLYIVWSKGLPTAKKLIRKIKSR